MPTVRAGGIQLHYIERVGDGPTVVFLHAALSSGRQWLPVLSRLVAPVHAIAPDMRGHGQSDKPDHDNDNLGMAADVAALLDSLGIERAFLVGLSMGGSVALRFAVQHPRRVRGLVIVGSNAVNPVTRRASPGWWERAQRAYQEEDALRRFVTSVYAIAPAEDALRADMEDARQASYHVWFTRRVGPPATELLEGLARLDVPALVVHGENDRIASLEAAERLHALLSGSRLEVWTGHGHFLPQEDPARFAALVDQFVARHA